MDIKKIIGDAVKKLEGNPDLIKEFTAEPVKTLEKLLGIDLPDEQINAVIDGIKAKLKIDSVANGAKGALDGIMGMFGKK